MKKRILSLVLALVMCVGLAAPAFANQRPHLYAYSYDVKGQEEYAGDRLSFFVQAYGHNFDTSAFTLGKGIFIDDPNDLEKVLFPIWNGGNIVATFLITTSEDGAYYGSYSEAYAEQLNALKSTATYSRPLALVVSDRHFYAVVDNRWYDLSDSAGKYTIRSFMPQAELIVVDTTISVPHTIYPQARIPTSYKKPWKQCYVQPADSNGYCYAYALASILLNMGYTEYVPSDIKGYINKPGATKAELADYLSSKGLSCVYKNSDAYLSYQGVQRALYNGNSSIYISALSSVSGLHHAFVLYGYADDTLHKVYNVWNPWFKYVQVIDAETRIIPTNTTETFVWDNGYLYGIG